MYREQIEAFWFETFFQSTMEQVLASDGVVVPHGLLRGYLGVFILRWEGRFLVSAPPRYAQRFLDAMEDGADLLDEHVLHALLGRDMGAVVGPAWLGVADGPLQEKSMQSVHVYDSGNAEDVRMLGELRKSSPKDMWEAAMENAEVIVIQQQNGHATAAASCRRWHAGIGQASLITSSSLPGQEYAQSALIALRQIANAQTIPLQFRAALSNEFVILAAQASGFVPFATQLSVRLRKGLIR